MTIEDLWKKISIEFEKVNKRFEHVDDQFERIDNQFERIDTQFEQIDNQFVQIYECLDEIKYELGIMKNSNLSQILIEQTKQRKQLEQTKKEIIQKLDIAIEQNNVEHKKYEYQIAELQMNQKIVNQ